MFINISNHPLCNWSSHQLAAVKEYGNVIDLPFPTVNPSGNEEYIRVLCDDYLKKINEICRDAARRVSTATVHIMGEMTLTYALVNALQKQGAICIASTTERISVEKDGMKTSEFRFVQFRKYR